MSTRRKSKPWETSPPIPLVDKRKSSSPIIRRKSSLITTPEPLISTSYLEVGRQRMLVVSLFLLLQAYKLGEALGLSGSTEGFLFKYLVLDGLFVFLLPTFRIPWLTFNNLSSLFLFSVLSIFNIILSNSAFTITGLLLFARSFFDSEVSFSGNTIKDQAFDAKSHLLGKYTVNILPESTALLNPGAVTNYCVGSNSLSVSIPIRLNATDPIFIQLSRVDFETLEETTLNFTRKELSQFRSSFEDDDVTGDGSGVGGGAGAGSGGAASSLSYLSLPVNTTGLYRLKKVTDSSNLDVRLYRSDVLVVSCPTAHIIGKEENDVVANDRCIGDVDQPTLFVIGVPPLRAKYSKSVKGRELQHPLQSLQPDHFHSPLLSGTNNRFLWSKDSPLDWAKAYTVNVDLESTLTVAGQWIYEIDEVEDALGNIVNYSRLLQSGNSALSSSKGLSYGFIVHPRPQIKFQGCDSVNPVKLPKGHFTELPISLLADSDDYPFEAVFDHVQLDENGDGNHYDDDNRTTVFTHKFNSLSERIRISEPGIYSIRAISGKYCPGDVIEPSSCLVYVPPLPTVEIKFEDIEDKCAGPTGVRVDISVSGNPPFSLSYRIIKDNKVVSTKTHDISKSRDQLLFNPSEEGNYTYEFFSLSDDLYKGISLQGETFKKQQSIHVLAGASFAEKSIHTRRCCSGDSLKLNVKLNGIPPLKLGYEIVSANGRKKQYSISDINTMSYEIETPSLTKGGRYTISLVSVEDSRGCVTPLNEKDIIAEVRRQRPGASFLPIDGTTDVKTLEGRTVDLRLRLSGKSPWSISYKHIDESGNEEDYATTATESDATIPVNKKGKYVLTSVSDAYCPGDVSKKNDAINVSWIDKPSFSVTSTPSLSLSSSNTFSRNDVCELEEDSFEISLEGKSTQSTQPPITRY